MVNEAIGARRLDGGFIKTLGVDLAALQSSDLGADQRGSVLEVLRAIFRVDLKLPVMGWSKPPDAACAGPRRMTRSRRPGTRRRRNDVPAFPRNAPPTPMAAGTPSMTHRRPHRSRPQRSGPGAFGPSSRFPQEPNSDCPRIVARPQARQTRNRRRSRISASGRAACGRGRVARWRGL